MVHGKTFKDPDNGRFLKPDEVDLSNSKLPTIKATGKSPAVSFEKMSKSKFNGIDPRNVVSEYGADVVRLYMLYKAHPSDVLEYDTSGIVGMQRWLNKLFKIASSIQPSFALVSPSELQDRISWAPENKKTYFLAQKAIKKSTETFEDTYSFNTFIALLIELSNHISLLPQNLLLHKSTFYAFEKLVIMLSPLAPVSSEELYEIITVNSLSSDSSSASDLDPLSSCGGLKAGSVFANQWPVLDESGLALDSFTCVVQVNGKVKFKLDADSSLLQNNDDLKAHVLSCPDLKKHLFDAADGVPKAFKKVIFVNGGKLINFILA
ncbi:Leucine-tRNA ligase, mitochondrial [Zancudomyces culisetae]|uniref:leucine--tRNA ligase n=1 Tax=Zancudomyces culisetae TaxID=1213189 RepID=A0A1R1PJW3_ZANCU|nr:Leucine-tRNA ligase, mitochondrial [Zancudomyces culisetae]|eukprot:OMH81256.1 Leucine-tRNA ligase, mitochondrial [Zancudomyces culisetae]